MNATISIDDIDLKRLRRLLDAYLSIQPAEKLEQVAAAKRLQERFGVNTWGQDNEALRAQADPETQSAFQRIHRETQLRERLTDTARSWHALGMPKHIITEGCVLAGTDEGLSEEVARQAVIEGVEGL